MPDRRHVLAALAIALAFLAAVPPVQAQYSDLELGMSPAERDSLLAIYDNIFPIWGRKALEKGIRTPRPLGLNLNYFNVDQGIEISNLGLAVNDGDWVDMSNVIIFDKTTSTGENVNVRPDLWVLPFLNVYGLLGQTWATTSVAIASPVAFTTTAEMEGLTYGAGFTAAGGLQGWWFAYDTNWAWSDLDLLADPVRTRTLGIRAGKNYRWQDKSVALWFGAMKVELDSGTEGTVLLSDVLPDIPPQLGDRFEEWYAGLTPPQQSVVDGLIDEFGGTLGDTEVHYNLAKAPTEPWTMAIGGQIELSRAWQVRSEFNFLGDRTSILVNLVYRIDI